MSPLMGMILFVGSILLLAILKTNEHLKRIASLLERTNELRWDARTGPSEQ